MTDLLPPSSLTVYDEPRPVLYDAHNREIVRAVGYQARWIRTRGERGA